MKTNRRVTTHLPQMFEITADVNIDVWILFSAKPIRHRPSELFIQNRPYTIPKYFILKKKRIINVSKKIQSLINFLMWATEMCLTVPWDATCS